jgi:hypothetical protein
MTSIKNDVLGVLQEKGYEKHCYPLDALLKTVETNNKYAIRKVRVYKWSGIFLLTFIPLISALLSVLVNLKSNSPSWLPESIVFPLSLALTLFTILNSIFKPSERFSEACRIGIGIDRFMADFLIDLERLTKVDESVLLELVDKKRKDFETYQIELIRMFMPMDVAAQTKEPS